ncbi:hypothetical protein VTO73DRAFT_9199 [Trametes versicolor]
MWQCTSGNAVALFPSEYAYFPVHNAPSRPLHLSIRVEDRGTLCPHTSPSSSLCASAHAVQPLLIPSSVTLHHHTLPTIHLGFGTMFSSVELSNGNCKCSCKLELVLVE